MKKMLFTLGLMALTLFSLSAFAQAVAAPSLADVILQLLSLAQGWKSVGVYAGIAAALKLLIDGSKALGLFDKIPAMWQALSVVLVGFLTVGLGAMAAGSDSGHALVAALGSSAGAMLLHEVAQDLFPPKV